MITHLKKIFTGAGFLLNNIEFTSGCKGIYGNLDHLVVYGSAFEIGAIWYVLISVIGHL